MLAGSYSEAPSASRPACARMLLGGFVALLGQEHLVRLFVDGEVARLGHALAGARVGLALLAHQMRHHLVHGQVHGRCGPRPGRR